MLGSYIEIGCKCKQKIELNFQGELLSDDRHSANSSHSFFINVANNSDKRQGLAKVSYNEFSKTSFLKGFITFFEPEEVRYKSMSLNQ